MIAESQLSISLVTVSSNVAGHGVSKVRIYQAVEVAGNHHSEGADALVSQLVDISTDRTSRGLECHKANYVPGLFSL